MNVNTSQIRKNICIYFSPEEKQIVIQAAKREGLLTATWIRHQILKIAKERTLSDGNQD